MKTLKFFLITLLIVILIVACGSSPAGSMDPAAFNTMVAQTAQVQLTQAAAGQQPVALAVAAASTPTAIPPVQHLVFPGEPGTHSDLLTDTSSTATAGQGRAPGGDFFQENRFERPFAAQTLQYLPAVDIQQAALTADGTWFYVVIKLAGDASQAAGLPAAFAVEVDTNVDGRGDLLIWAAAQTGTQWTSEGVQVWADGNHDVGGTRPLAADQPGTGDGYETSLFDSGQGSDPDAAWVRIAPDDPASVQIAFKQGLLGNNSSFTWGAWADAGLRQPGWFDYNDRFSPAEAGSSNSGDENYPPNAVTAVDNTCRLAYGFRPSNQLPGMCLLPATSAPTPEPVSQGSIPIPTTAPVTNYCRDYPDMGTCIADPLAIGGCYWDTGAWACRP